MKILIANWKMNPATLDEALGLFDFYLAEMRKYQNIQLVVCPPFVYIEELYKKLEAESRKLGAAVTLGAQDLFWDKSGPYTGEISVDMLNPALEKDNELKYGQDPVLFKGGVKNFGVTHVLVGHSDRRYKMGLPSTTFVPKVVLGETDEVINKKIKAALEVGITPVLLVGERNRGDDRKAILEQQLAADLADLTPEQVSKILITYEPVWAISTTSSSSPSTTFGTKVVLGKPDTPANTLEALTIIREFLLANYQLPTTNYQLLYGGSINAKNVAGFLKRPELSGAVIGGASLRKEEFGEILRNLPDH